MINALAYILCVLIWGSTWYLIEFQLGVVAPEWSVAYRFSLAALVLFIWVKLKRQSLSIDLEHHKYIAMLGFFLFSTNYLMIYYGTSHLTSGLVAVCFSLLTFLNILNGRIWLKTPISKETFIGALFGLIGLIFIFMPEVTNLNLEDETTIGIAFCIAGTFAASFGNTVASTPRLTNLPLLPVNAWGMLYGAIINVFYALMSGEPMAFDPRLSYWLSMLVLSVFGTVVAFVLYLWLMGQIGMTKVAYVAVLLPLVALTVSTIFEGYAWTTEAIIGLALIVAGNVIIIRFKQTPKEPTQEEPAPEEQVTESN